ncbi:uncharacterized protein DUF3302 [Sinobacterium caligoides]|uniref:Uncharacterized protein DUF3302 n=1 Tax=Sinobacterium caligoides TaxID=933926 RepID=A0A3N2E244_9GAMM|nr:DUF3302 domain-containing protein [Sinobacterium caligoides]ROS05645.1 uncharacterized protein DUF3302 [Sinobacterium caligoides]
MLEYFALVVLCLVALVLFYGIIVLHDIPYEIAKHRDHPHQDAIHAAGWVSLFTLHVLWPFLWIWAMLYREDRGWGFGHHPGQPLPQRVAELEQVVEKLQAELVILSGSNAAQVSSEERG